MLNKSNYHILVIDDISSIHQDFRKILVPESTEQYQKMEEMNTLLSKPKPKAAGLPSFDLEFALQGSEGVSLVEKSLENNHPFAVAFVDVQMPPGYDGVDAIKKIWEIDKEIQTVICTAYAKYSWEDLQGKLGESDRLFILKKPFDNLEIIQLACSLCKKWNLNRLKCSDLSNNPQGAGVSGAIPNRAMERLNDAMEILSKRNKGNKPTQE